MSGVAQSLSDSVEGRRGEYAIDCAQSWAIFGIRIEILDDLRVVGRVIGLIAMYGKELRYYLVFDSVCSDSARCYLEFLILLSGWVLRNELEC